MEDSEFQKWRLKNTLRVSANHYSELLTKGKLSALGYLIRTLMEIAQVKTQLKIRQFKKRS